MLQASVQVYKSAYKGLSPSIWWLAGVMLVNRSGTMVIPFLTVYLTDKGYSLAQAGFVMGAFGAGSIVGSFIGGKLTDKIGFYYVQFFSLLFNGILFFILERMQSLIQITGCIFLLSSLGEAFRPANAAAIAAYSNESNRTRCYSLNRLAINLGWAVGPAVGGLLASISYSYLFWADGGTCIAASVLLLLFLNNPERPVPQKNAEAVVVHSAYKDGFFLKTMGLIFLISICFFQLFSLVPVYYRDHIHLSKAIIGVVLALNGIVIAVVEMVLIYKIENKRPPFQYMFAGAFLIGLSYLLLTVSAGLGIVLVSMITITFGEMFLFPFVNSFWVSRSTGSNRGQYASVYSISFALALVLAPTLASQTALLFGFNTLWVANFFICMLAAFGFLALQKNLFLHDSL